MGHNVVHEVARTYIDERISNGETIEKIMEDEILFQKNILQKKIDIENNLSKEHMTFLDRGIPDSDAYYKLYKIQSSVLFKNALKKCSYKKVFLLDQLPYDPDYARTETKEQQDELHKLLGQVYQKLGLTIIKVPIFTTKEDRVDFVLKNL